MTDEHDHDAHDHDQAHEHEHHHHHAAPMDYPTAVAAYRAEKDAAFKEGAHSPIPADERAAFEGIPYFPVREDLVFEGLKLEPYQGDEPSRFQIPTSDNRLKPARRAGTFSFEVDGTPVRLTGYEVGDQPSDGSIFLPFLDATSGTETYGAGRYLDLEPDEDGTYGIDFNLAYHPLCVFSPNFSCPITPAENRLPVRIEAGERLAEGHDH
jgi:uncharacterized protein (DUF1684 family)